MTLDPTIWSKNAILSEKQGGKNGFLTQQRRGNVEF